MLNPSQAGMKTDGQTLRVKSSLALVVCKP